MMHKWKYATPAPFGDLWMLEENGFLAGLFFDGARDDSRPVPAAGERLTPVLDETRRWLDRYFSRRPTGAPPPLRFQNSTPFRAAVLAAVQAIPFGQTATYGSIAAAIARQRGLPAMSAQAVGGAVGWNPVCLIVPCHRVVGAAHSIGGYGGGLANKLALLAHEGVDLSRYRLPAVPPVSPD